MRLVNRRIWNRTYGGVVAGRAKPSRLPDSGFRHELVQRSGAMCSFSSNTCLEQVRILVLE